MGFIKKAFDFISQPTHSRTMGLVGILAFVGIISLTVVVAQQQQNLKQKASGSETCSSIDDIWRCPSDFQSNSSCSSENSKCKIGNTIYECQNVNNKNN